MNLRKENAELQAWKNKNEAEKHPKSRRTNAKPKPTKGSNRSKSAEGLSVSQLSASDAEAERIDVLQGVDNQSNESVGKCEFEPSRDRANGREGVEMATLGWGVCCLLVLNAVTSTPQWIRSFVNIRTK